MTTPPLRNRLQLPSVAVASLALLQPGIDPVFLTLLSAAHRLPPASHGWIVGATQAGMALGSMAAWRLGENLRWRESVLAACAALAASMATAQAASGGAILGVRGLYGLAMGLLYTQAMAAAARGRPSGSYGSVFLVQLVLSTGVALLLPIVSDIFGPRTALAVLCLAPLTTLLTCVIVPTAIDVVPSSHALLTAEAREPIGARGWLYAASALAFICATMMVWSFTGALALEARIDEDVVGRAVALGSLAGAATALVVMRERKVVPPTVSGLLAGATLLAPIVGAGRGDMAFVMAIVLFNLGSTAIIVRTSGLASAASADRLFRRFVACTHSLGMIAGPVLGGLAAWMFGSGGLLAAAVLAIAAGCLTLVLAGRQTHVLQRSEPGTNDPSHAYLAPTAG